MPLALFLISLIVSGSLFVTTTRVSQDSRLQQNLLASTAAFYTAGSSAEVSWAQVTPETSPQLIEAFKSAYTDQGGQTPTDYIQQTLASGGPQATLELNLGIQANAKKNQLSLSKDSLIESFYQNSAEIFLFDVPPDQAVDFLQLEYCQTDDEFTCPDLIIDWMEIKSGFQFQQLQSLVDAPSNTDPISACEDFTDMKIKRCIVKSTSMLSGDLTSSTPFDSSFSQAIKLKTNFASVKHYLFRFRSIDRNPFSFRLSGSDSLGQTKPLPNTLFEIDEIGTAKSTFRRIRQQRMVSGGLQDGLEFVHYADEVKPK